MEISNMATFAKSLESKLKSLEATQTGIQTLSLWIIHHRHHANIITEAWRERVKKVPRSDKRLGLFYLANDVVQNGRKKAKDLVLAFGKVFYEVIPLYSDEKTKAQVERVFNIWIERSVYEADFIAKLRNRLGESKITKSPVKPKPKVEEEEQKKVEVSKPRKIVPPDFKVANLLVSIKKSTSLDSDVTRKSKKLDNLKIDASSYDSVKHVKDRSSVGKFHKQFEESKIILDDYIHTLRRTEKDKRNLMTLLTAGEAFYSLAQDEAKVIVNAYSTFGNRLNSMKRKLDAKIKKMEESGEVSSIKPDGIDSNKERKRDNSAGSIQDMDLDSDSGDDIPKSDMYNPAIAPMHDDVQPDGGDNTHTMENQQLNTTRIQDKSDFFNPQIMNGMSSFLPSMNSLSGPTITLNMQADTSGITEMSNAVTTPISEKAETPDGLVIDDPFALPPHSFMQNTAPTTYGGVSLDNNMLLTTSLNSTRAPPMNTQQPNQTHTNSDKNPAVQNLIDSLFPVLSKSLQTIKEKTQAAEEKPSVNAAMAFALGEPSDVGDEVSRKKPKLDADGSSAISPVSLTNPKGLSEHQEELINIAAGLTEFDENFLPVTKESSLSRTQSYEDEQRKEKTDKDLEDKKREDRRSSSSGRHRHRSHKESSSRSPQRRSPQRRSSHRSGRDSKDSRDERRSDKRRSSRRSPSPRRRKGNRGGRSSSKEKDDKRKHSPESSKNVYYNNRRSPTPEMDSSAGSQFPQQNVIAGQQPPPPISGQQSIPNPQQVIPTPQPVIPGQPPINPSNPGLIINPIMANPQFQLAQPGAPTNAVTDTNNPVPFVNPPGILMNHPPMFSTQTDQNKQQQQQPSRSQEENDNLETMKEKNPSQLLPSSQQNQSGLDQIPNNFHMDIRPPGAIMPFNVNIRPQPTSQVGVSIPSQNPLQLLQQRVDDPKPLRFPLTPRMIPFNQPPRFLAVGNQDNTAVSHDDEPSERFCNNLENMGSQHTKVTEQPQPQQQSNMIQQRPQLVPPHFDANNPPPFPGAPPVPPPFLRPTFPAPVNQEMFNPGAPRFIGGEMLDVRNPSNDGNEMLKVRPGFLPDRIQTNDSMLPNMNPMHNNDFNRPQFEPRHQHDQRPRFRPHFNSPGRPPFRPRTRFLRPPI